MGSVLSAPYSALRSFVIAQLDKAEAKRLLECYPRLRDLPAEELEAHLRRLIDERKEQDRHPLPSWSRESNDRPQQHRCNYMLVSKRGG